MECVYDNYVDLNELDLSLLTGYSDKGQTSCHWTFKQFSSTFLSWDSIDGSLGNIVDV